MFGESNCTLEIRNFSGVYSFPFLINSTIVTTSSVQGNTTTNVTSTVSAAKKWTRFSIKVTTTELTVWSNNTLVFNSTTSTNPTFFKTFLANLPATATPHIGNWASSSINNFVTQFSAASFSYTTIGGSVTTDNFSNQANWIGISDPSPFIVSY